MQPDPRTCDRCPKPSAGICCSSHGKELCHEDYRLTHFVEVCGCRQCEAEGLPKILPRSQPKPVTTPDPSPRWTPETERLLIRVGYARFRRDPGVDLDELYEDVAAWDEWRDDVRAYLTALADAGLLLPPGGETRTEWGEALPGCVPDVIWRDPASAVGWEATHRRTVHVGPWEVTDGE